MKKEEFKKVDDKVVAFKDFSFNVSKNGSVLSIQLFSPGSNNPVFLTLAEAEKMRANLNTAIVKLKEAYELKSKVGDISSYLDSLQTSVEAAERQLADCDVETASQEISDMYSDMRDLSEIIDKF